jgi:hypothetical protein
MRLGIVRLGIGRGIRRVAGRFGGIGLGLAGLMAALLVMLNLAAAPASAAGQPPFGSYLLSCRDVRVQNLLGGSGANIVASCRTADGRYVTSMLPVDCDGDIANVNGQLRCNASTPANQPPYGSYQQSCYGAYMTGPILHANCHDMSGRPQQTTLNVLNCKGDIANINGQLSCKGASNQPPPGSYQQSCVGAYMTGPILNAQCRNQNGRNVQAQLNVLGCRDDIANINGYLTCQGRGFGPIVVYAGTGWQGASRTISYAIPDLRNIGFSNMIQSVTIAQGAWEFCTAPFFSGRCIRLSRSSPDLGQMGMSFQISSVRPVR